MGTGQSRGGFSPFDIFFNFASDSEIIEGFEPLDPHAVACYEAISVRRFLNFKSSIFVEYNKHVANVEHEWSLFMRRLLR